MLFEPGSHLVAVTSPNYKPMTDLVEIADNVPFTIQFILDPIVVPKEISPEYVSSLHRKDETVFVGYVVDDEPGEPLENVVIRSEPSGAKAVTDARGYFQIYVPLQTLAEAKTSPAKLNSEKPGYNA